MSDPTADANSLGSMLNAFPGGPVSVQLTVVLAVFAGMLFKMRNGFQVLVGVAALVLTGAGMAVMGYGSWVMASITAVSVGSGALIYRAWFQGGAG